MSWGILVNGKLEPVAFRCRSQAQIYAGRRFISASEYEEATGHKDVFEFSHRPSAIGHRQALYGALSKRPHQGIFNWCESFSAIRQRREGVMLNDKELAAIIARAIFEAPHPTTWPVTRIQFMGQVKGNQEANLGGFSEGPLADYIERVLNKHRSY